MKVKHSTKLMVLKRGDMILDNEILSNSTRGKYTWAIHKSTNTFTNSIPIMKYVISRKLPWILSILLKQKIVLEKMMGSRMVLVDTHDSGIKQLISDGTIYEIEKEVCEYISLFSLPSIRIKFYGNGFTDLISFCSMNNFIECCDYFYYEDKNISVAINKKTAEVIAVDSYDYLLDNIKNGTFVFVTEQV